MEYFSKPNQMTETTLYKQILEETDTALTQLPPSAFAKKLRLYREQLNEGIGFIENLEEQGKPVGHRVRAVCDKISAKIALILQS